MDHARLKARETRSKQINEKLKSPLIYTVITLKANIPGPNKNLMESYFLTNLFTNELIKKITVKTKDFIKSADGPYVILSLNDKAHDDIKNLCISIEDYHPLGRFIDIDVYSKNSLSSITRKALLLAPRTCFLCNNDAQICARANTHTTIDLIKHIKNNVESYLLTTVTKLVDDAITKELTLEDKFGLVTKSSSGSHIDMNYELMLNAKEVIVPYFIEMFKLGLHTKKIDQLFILGRQIGLKAENEMLIKTNQINCYKGLIFSLGIALMALSHTLLNKQDFSHIFENIKEMTKNLDQEFDQDIDSYGIKAYQLYGIKGARGEAMSGFKSVQYVLKKATKEAFSDTHLRAILKDLIVKTDDTVLLKRAGSFQSYQTIKAEVNVLDIANLKAVKAFTQKAIDNNLSFGGAADLLVVTIFLHQVKHQFFNEQL